MKMTPAQLAKLEMLRKKRELYNVKFQKLDAEFKVAKRALKQELLEASREAADEGISTRQIHLALGFQQAAQMLSFFGEAEGMGQKITNLLARKRETETVDSEVDIRVEGKYVYITDIDGTSYLGGFSGSFPVTMFYFYDLPNGNAGDVSGRVLNAIGEWSQNYENIEFNFEQRSS